MRSIRPTTHKPKVHTTPTLALEGIQSEIWNPETQAFEPHEPLKWNPDNDGGAWAMSGGRVLWR